VVAQRAMLAQNAVDAAVGWLSEQMFPERKLSVRRAWASLQELGRL